MPKETVGEFSVLFFYIPFIHSHWGSDSLSLHLSPPPPRSEISLGIAYDTRSTKDPPNLSTTNRTGECREHRNTVS